MESSSNIFRVSFQRRRILIFTHTKKSGVYTGNKDLSHLHSLFFLYSVEGRLFEDIKEWAVTVARLWTISIMLPGSAFDDGTSCNTQGFSLWWVKDSRCCCNSTFISASQNWNLCQKLCGFRFASKKYNSNFVLFWSPDVPCPQDFLEDILLSEVKNKLVIPQSFVYNQLGRQFWRLVVGEVLHLTGELEATFTSSAGGNTDSA